MISDPKLPFDSAPTGVETRAEASPDGPHELPSSDTGPVPQRSYSTARLWLRRIGVLLFVFLCATIGVMLMIVPWRPEWSDNPLLMAYPVLRDLIGSGFVRGLVTGLGLL